MRYFALSLIVLVAAACGGGATNAVLETTNESSPQSDAQPHHTPEPSPPSEKMVAYNIKAGAVHITVLEKVADDWAKLDSVQVPFPEWFGADETWQHSERLVVAHNAESLLITFSTADDQPAAELHKTRCIAQLRRHGRLSEVVLSEALPGMYITAVTASNDGWLIGLVERKPEQYPVLAIRHAVNELGLLRWTDVWSRKNARHTNGGAHGKEIDAFCRKDSTIIAIDDVVLPKYAVLLSEEADSIRVLGEEDLIPGANERYYAGAFDGTHLAALSEFGHRGGNGQRIRSYRLIVDELIYKHGWGEMVPRVHDDEGYRLVPEESVLLGGRELTPWSGVVLLNGWAIVAARARGLMMFDVQGSTEGAKTIEAGFCSDIRWVGDEVFVLQQITSQTWLTRVTLDAENRPVLEQLVQLEPVFNFAD